MTITVVETELQDAAAGSQTTYHLDIGTQFDGGLASGSDEDWVEVTLQAGESYVFSVWGRDGSGGLVDPTLSLYNSSGAYLGGNDDIEPSHGNFFSLFEFTAQSSGSYYLGVTDFDAVGGDYTLQVASDTWSNDLIADYLTEFSWGQTLPLAFAAGPGSTISVNLTGLTAAGQKLARWALESWSQATGLVFEESTSSGALIVFDDNQSGAFAGPSNFFPSTGQINQAIVNVNTSRLSGSTLTVDSDAYFTYLHEIGHALGLGHAGPYDGAASYGEDNAYRNDSNQVSVMSYFTLADNTAIPGNDFTPLSPMVADLMAMQRIYGTPQVHAGDTVWGANATVGGWLGDLFAILFDGAAANSSLYAGGNVGLTLFDTGGTDTLDLSSMNMAQSIDLRPEAVSDIAGLRGNLVIARGTVIENAIGGSGNDLLRGNAADNRLTGKGGNDTVIGGDGTDTAVIAGNRADATVSQTATGLRIVSGAGTDLFQQVELFEFSDGLYTEKGLLQSNGTPGQSLVGTSGEDTLIGTEDDDTLNGTGGNDTIAGQDGNDSLIGGLGDDEISGSAGNDTIDGGSGNDNMGGGQGNDVIIGGFGNDTMGGGAGNDSATAGDGHDGVFGGTGDDTLGGGAGNDTMAGGFNHDIVNGGAGNDDMGGGTGRDNMTGGAGNDTMGAGEGDDTMNGGDGNDVVNGGGRSDVINGGAGDDRINGGNDNDTMTGGAGDDLFIFNEFRSGDEDVITDWTNGEDMFRMTGVQNAPGTGLAGKVAALNATQVGSDVVLTYEGHTITLQGASVSDIGAGDFLFL